MFPARTADEPKLEKLEPDESLYQVFVDDNFHYRDESHRYLDGQFATYEEAVAHCRAIVDSDLENAFKPGATAEERFATYSLFGLDPFIKTPAGRQVAPPFSAWDYAQERCGILPRDSTISKA